jgi:putative oxidoreductase
MSIGLLILRLAVGLSLAAHGAQKLFGWFGGYGIAGTGQFLEQAGLRPGRMYAAQAGLAEVVAGLFLATGLLTPAASAVVVAVMVVAAVIAHLKNGFFVQNGGYEHTLLLAVAGATLAFTGPGTLSLDHAFGIHWSGGSWGLIAVAIGLVGGALPLLGRKAAPASATQRAA